MCTDKNARWIYTYDYAPGSVWEKWRDSDKEPEWIKKEAEAVIRRVRKELPCFILLADSHFAFNGTWDDTAAALRALSSMLPIKGIIHLGDLTDGMLPAEKTREERSMFDSFISLGWYCGTASAMSRHGLRKMSSPFDWSFSELYGVMHFLESDFNDFMLKDNIEVINNRPKEIKDIKWGIYFNHDVKEDYEKNVIRL